MVDFKEMGKTIKASQEQLGGFYVVRGVELEDLIHKDTVA